MFLWHLNFDPYKILRPLLFLLDGEDAHNFTIKMLKSGMGPGHPPVDDPILVTSLWGKTFPNPIGLAAGLDKQAEVPDALSAFGFGFLELGGVTPNPQPGNPRPRMFRAPQLRALINRFGLNSVGMDVIAERLAKWREHGAKFPRPVGINLAKNKETVDDVSDYVKLLKKLGGYADFVTINVSSPNTPGLRDLQGAERLRAILQEVTAVRDQAFPDLAILVKISPDLTVEQEVDTIAAIMSAKVQGIIVSNTTTKRPAKLGKKLVSEAGGLSGEPLRDMALEQLKRIRSITKGAIPLIASGGIATAQDVLARIKAGASLVQIYTVLVYEGPKVVEKITMDLAELLHSKGFKSLSEAIGIDA